MMPLHTTCVISGRGEVASLLKEIISIFTLSLPLVLRQDFMWVSPTIGCCMCVNRKNYKDTHTKRLPEYKHSRIPTEVGFNLSLLCIGKPPYALSPAIPTSSGRPFPCFRKPMYFGFFGHCIWGVRCTANLLPLLVQEIIMDTYTPPPPLATSHMIHGKRVAAAIAYQGGIIEG